MLLVFQRRHRSDCRRAASDGASTAFVAAFVAFVALDATVAAFAAVTQVTHASVMVLEGCEMPRPKLETEPSTEARN